MSVSECTDEDNYSSSVENESQLQRDRTANNLRLKRRFEDIFDKYDKDFTGIGDEIDISTGDVVVDNGHLEHMRHEVDPGDAASSQFVKAFADNLEHEDDEEGEGEEEEEEESSDDDREEEDETLPEGSMFEQQWSSSEDDPLSEGMEPLETPKQPPMSGSMFQLLQAQAGVSYTGEENEMSGNDSSLAPVPRPRKVKIKKQKRKDVSVDAIQTLGQNIADQIAQFMQLASGAKQSNKKSRPKDAAWDYPELPRKKRKTRSDINVTQRQEASRRSLAAAISPMARSLWAPAPSLPRRKQQREDNQIYGLPKGTFPTADNTSQINCQDFGLPFDANEDLQEHHPEQEEDYITEQEIPPQQQKSHIQQQDITPSHREETALEQDDVPLWQNDEQQHPYYFTHEQDEGTGVDTQASDYLDELRISESPVKHAANVGTKRRFTLEENVLLVKLKEIDRVPWERISAFFPSRSVGGLQNHLSLRAKDTWYEEAWSVLESQGHRFTETRQTNGDDSLYARLIEDEKSSATALTRKNLHENALKFSPRGVASELHKGGRSQLNGLDQHLEGSPQYPRDKPGDLMAKSMRLSGSTRPSTGTKIIKSKKVQRSPPFPITDFGIIPDKPAVSLNLRYWFKYRTRYIEAEDLQLSYLRGVKKLPWNTIELWFPNRSGKTLGVRWLNLPPATTDEIDDPSAETTSQPYEYIARQSLEPDTTSHVESEPEQNEYIENQAESLPDSRPESRCGDENPYIADSEDDDQPYFARAPLLQSALRRNLRQRSSNVAPTNYYDTIVDKLKSALDGTENAEIADVQEGGSSTAPSQQGEVGVYSIEDNSVGEYWPVESDRQIISQEVQSEATSEQQLPNMQNLPEESSLRWPNDVAEAIDPQLLAEAHVQSQTPQWADEKQSTPYDNVRNVTSATKNKQNTSPQSSSELHLDPNLASSEEQKSMQKKQVNTVRSMQDHQEAPTVYSITNSVSRDSNDDDDNIYEFKGGEENEHEQQEGARATHAITIDSSPHHKPHRPPAIESRSNAKIKTRLSYPPVNTLYPKLKTPTMDGRASGKLPHRSVRFSIPGPSSSTTKRRVVETPVREVIDSDEDELA